MPYRLLLADDSITIQKVMEKVLGAEGFEVTACGDGESALRAAKNLAPDIVLADVFMPVMDGYELCGRLKADPELGRVPVLLLAGTFEEFDNAAAARAQADGHIMKPFDTADLVARVKAAVEKDAEADVPVAEEAIEVPETFEEAEVVEDAIEIPEEIPEEIIEMQEEAMDIPEAEEAIELPEEAVVPFDEAEETSDDFWEVADLHVPAATKTETPTPEPEPEPYKAPSEEAVFASLAGAGLGPEPDKPADAVRVMIREEAAKAVAEAISAKLDEMTSLIAREVAQRVASEVMPRIIEELKARESTKED